VKKTIASFTRLCGKELAQLTENEIMGIFDKVEKRNHRQVEIGVG